MALSNVCDGAGALRSALWARLARAKQVMQQIAARVAEAGFQLAQEVLRFLIRLILTGRMMPFIFSWMAVFFFFFNPPLVTHFGSRANQRNAQAVEVEDFDKAEQVYELQKLAEDGRSYRRWVSACPSVCARHFLRTASRGSVWMRAKVHARGAMLSARVHSGRWIRGPEQRMR